MPVVTATAVAVLFSSFSTPFLSGLFTAGVFLLGRSVPEIELIAAKVDSPGLAQLLDVFARVLPDLRYFYVTGSTVHGEHLSINGTFVDSAYLATAAGYALLYVAVALLLSIVLFARRDFV